MTSGIAREGQLVRWVKHDRPRYVRLAARKARYWGLFALECDFPGIRPWRFMARDLRFSALVQFHPGR